MHPLIKMLAGGDRRSIGRSNEVVSLVLADPALFDIVLSGMLLDDALIRMRCADAAEKITRLHPNYLRPYKTVLLEKLVDPEQPEVRWHLAPMLVRLPLSETEQEVVFEILFKYLYDRSSIVQTFSLQALYDLAELNVKFQPRVYRLAQKMAETGAPAVKARANKLLIKIMRSSSE
jgi:hypothetical protein